MSNQFSSILATKVQISTWVDFKLMNKEIKGSFKSVSRITFTLTSIMTACWSKCSASLKMRTKCSLTAQGRTMDGLGPLTSTMMLMHIIDLKWILILANIRSQLLLTKSIRRLRSFQLHKLCWSLYRCSRFGLIEAPSKKVKMAIAWTERKRRKETSIKRRYLANMAALSSNMRLQFTMASRTK